MGPTTPRWKVPFGRVSLLGPESQYVGEVIAGAALASDGAFTRRCEALITQVLGAPRTLLTPSCTHALEMAALLLDLQAGDEVIVPGYTFVATANAFALRGARIVFADIDADTLSIDPSSVAARLSARTRAIVVVHYGGAACQLDRLTTLASESGAALIEDNAHGLFGRWGDRPLGTVGALGTLSFHSTKNLTCGEGGALIVNRPDLIDRAEQIRAHGTDRARYLRGEVDRYTWQELGSSYFPSELQAAFLLAQLEHRDRVLARRRSLWLRYHRELSEWAARHETRLPPAREGSTHHVFHLLLPDPARARALAAHLAQQGVEAIGHYVPLHLSAMGRRLGYRAGHLPVVESVSERMLRLPLPNDLTDDEQTLVLDAVRSFAP
jgi:dTDP-4-amino-4,6-dideoxygalactose transaminase